jgi:phospholipid/cholesterol/gamma-HCH transport system permease protein
MPATAPQPAALQLDDRVLRCHGSWTLGHLAGLRTAVQGLTLPAGAALTLDGDGIAAIDTAGAWLLLELRKRVEAAGGSLDWRTLRASWQHMLEFLLQTAGEKATPLPQRRSPSWLDRSADLGASLTSFLAFIGETILALLVTLRHPGRVRWTELLDDMFETGVNALPIIGLLSFLMGVVIAYQGAVQLRQYGANIYLADLVGYSMLRELAPLLTAILVCGRTGSAYAAKIGTMKVREEVDALQTIGISPVDLLVLPKLLSLLIVLPLLSVYADVMSMLGGMFMASVQLGVGYHAFLARLGEAIDYSTFMIGISKTPVFAAIIAVVGCYQGFHVAGSAESVGRQTTVSVVQSIFLVIVVDAIFSIVTSLLGV